MSNEVGDYAFLPCETFDLFLQKQLKKESKTFQDLKTKYFLYDDTLFLPDIIEVLSTRYRTKHQFLYDRTSLHMFVVTLRCNQMCKYCHASSQDNYASKNYDMDRKTAMKSVEFAFHTPSPSIKIEFQGGEPLLNFEIVKTIVKYANELNERYQKHLEFVICTNLVDINRR